MVLVARLDAALGRPLAGLHPRPAPQPPGRARRHGARRGRPGRAPSPGWRTDLVRAIGGSRPEHGRYEFTGITKQARFAYGKTAITIAALLVAIQWPLHMNPGIQSILTTQVAIYVLLAMGLNVVVGFAGLLDLGYVAFWAIGAYTTAYFTGALPIQPPFILNPFWIIPFAIVAAMLTGVLLGTPTLRLRGDYLAIVTLGFGEIIEIVANNLNGVTGGPAGTPGFIPQFSVHLFSVNYRWTGTVLPYYYLILGVAVVFTVAFSFLEHSRVGRSWTAIREDEVAADSVGHQRLEVQGHGLLPSEPRRPGSPGCFSPARSRASCRTTSSSRRRS